MLLARDLPTIRILTKIHRQLRKAERQVAFKMVRAAVQKEDSGLNPAKMLSAQKDFHPLVVQAELSFKAIRITLVQDYWFRRLQRVKVQSQSKLLLVVIQTGCRLNIS